MNPTMEPIEQLAEQSTEQVLLSGGDSRLDIDAITGVNRYGCSVRPDAGLIAFGSSTGSTISERGYAAAQVLHRRLLSSDSGFFESALYQNELERIRRELGRLCGFSGQSEVATIFAASGTDLHLICAQLLASDNPFAEPLHIIMMDASETGSGVAPALHGQHFSGHVALGGKVKAFETMQGARAVTVSSIGLRGADGNRRALSDIDAETNTLVEESIARQQRILLIMIDVSKTGLIAPSPQFVADLRRRCPEQVDVLVDACQFRIANATLNAYLNLGCMVALTGSKFLTGPVFSGILQIPSNVAARLSRQTLPAALADYSAQAEWPSHWQAASTLSDTANWGLLLRLEAALAELKAFRAIPEQQISAFLDQFAEAVQNAIQRSPHFELMAETRLDRSPICSTASWDRIPTIFPFLLLRQPGRPLSREETRQIYQQLQFPVSADFAPEINPALARLRCQLGQPVLCGTQYGMEVSAVRLCASSRIIIEACAEGSVSSGQVIQRVLQVLEKAESLIRKL